MDTYTVMICDDKEAVHESLTQFLEDAGISVINVYDGIDVLSTLKTHDVDLIILDVMMPRMDGMDTCRIIRRDSDIPIIFLSAKSEELDRISGLELGGDDYVTKPFSPRELTLKVKKILQRTRKIDDTPKEKNSIIAYKELSVDEEKMIVLVKDEQIDMTAKEVKLIAYLIHNKEKVLNREQILQRVWGYDYYGDTRTVDAVIKRIRKKLPTEGISFAIQSIYGVGYKLGGNS